MEQGLRPDKVSREGECPLTTPKSRNLWEEIGRRSPVSAFRFPSMGPKSRAATTRAPVIDSQIGPATERTNIVSFTHSSSKSPWTAREWFFVLMLPVLWTSFLPVVYRRFSLHLACGLCTEEIDATCFSAPRSRNFLPLDRPKSNAVLLNGNERPTQPPGSKSRLAFTKPHRSPAPGPIS